MAAERAEKGAGEVMNIDELFAPSPFAACTTNSSATSSPVTLDSIKGFIYEFERKFPKSKQAVRVRCGCAVLAEIRKAMPCGQLPELDHLSGLPIETDDRLGYPAYVIEYADGWEEVHCGDMLPVRRPTRKAEACNG